MPALPDKLSSPVSGQTKSFKMKLHPAHPTAGVAAHLYLVLLLTGTCYCRSEDRHDYPWVVKLSSGDHSILHMSRFESSGLGLDRFFMSTGTGTGVLG